VQRLQRREVRLNRQELLHKVRDIAGDDAPALRLALKQLAMERNSNSDSTSSASMPTLDNLCSSAAPAEASPAPAAAGVPAAAAAGPSADAVVGMNGLAAREAGGGATAASLPFDAAAPAASSGFAADGAATARSDAAAPPFALDAQSRCSALPNGGDAAAEGARGGTEAEGARGGGVAPPPSGGSSQPATGMPATLGQSNASGQQRLEVAAAAVLVHAASCKDSACLVPHCNKMKKIHSHFLECSVQDCAISKKLKPLTYIHAKHCTASTGECVIPYCARSKQELQRLMQQRASGQRASGAAAATGAPLMGQPAALAQGIVAPQPSFGSGVAAMMGMAPPMAPLDARPDGTVQAQAHYLLVLAHVMKCTSSSCSVPECSSTKGLVTNHTRQCRAGDACTYPRCALSKRLMRHHRECPDQACPICLPLRRRLAAAKMNSQPPPAAAAAAAAAAATQQTGPPRRKQSKRKKEEEEEEAGGKRKRKDSLGQNGMLKDSRLNGKKRALGSGGSTEHEAQIVAEYEVLESGFCVSVLMANGQRQSAGDEARGEWRSGVVMRTYTSAYEDEPVYDIMMRDGKEEKGVSHSRCRMVCSVCLSDKRIFRPPPMFCEKCFTAIRQRWSYWEEGGEEGGLKLCKRCFSDIKASPKPDQLLTDLAHRSNLKIDNFVEKKEKDRPEYVDNWVQCDECHSWMHWTCGLYKGEDTPDDCLFFCDHCRATRGRSLPVELRVPGSEALPETVLSQRLQKTLKDDLAALGVTCSPVTVRVVSNVQTVTKFDNQPGVAKGSNGKTGKEFPYRSKCILAFQRVEGHEVCFFAMYVQEYGSDCPEPNTNRVYISYLDSVCYFQSSPEGNRTTVYHSMLIAYLAYARELGFTHGHIWVSPPKQGDDYIFYAHPKVMTNKRMGLLKLKEWYERMLETAKQRQVVVDYQDMTEEFKDIESVDDIPMFSGDHWALSITNKMEAAKRKEEDKAGAGVKKKGPVAAPPAAGSEQPGGTPSPAAQNGTRSAGAIVNGPSKAGSSTETKQDEQLLNQITEEMRSMRNHFIVVTLIELKKGQQRATIEDPVPLMSNDFVDTRSAFLEKCQMYHWQFDELRNAQHSTLMLLYYLHGMHRDAKKRIADAASKAETGQGHAPVVQTSAQPGASDSRSRSSKIEMAMQDWSQLLAHANEASQNETWELPPEELFQRILAQINRSKRDILQEKYNACCEPSATAQAATAQATASPPPPNAPPKSGLPLAYAARCSSREPSPLRRTCRSGLMSPSASAFMSLWGANLNMSLQKHV